MTKKDLERRNDFLLLQLKIINELINDKELYHNDIKASEIRGSIKYLTRPDTIKDRISFIENHDLTYNNYNEDMTIDDYR